MYLKKVDNIALKELRNLEFKVPSYQRGYRWNKIHVEQFIEDIYEDDSDYCIQPLIVKPVGKYYYVIDGQQRLTTLIIMIGALKYLNKGKFNEDISLFLEYETRDSSKKLLDFLVNDEKFHKNSDRDLDDESFFKRIEELYDNKKSNLDFDYMLNTFLVAKKKYIEKHKEARKTYEMLYEQLINHCKVIWYPIDDNEIKGNCLSLSEQERNLDIEQFSKINMGKIPLTNAELIKAEFMNPNYYERDYKSEIKLIAEQWYYMENDLHNPDLWAFIPHDYQYEDNNHYRTRLDGIFEFLLITKHMKKQNGKCYSERYKEEMLQGFFLYNQINNWIKPSGENQIFNNGIFEKWEEVKEAFENIKELYEHDGRTQNYEDSSIDSTCIGLYNFMGYFLYVSRYILNDNKYAVWEEIHEIISEHRNNRLNIIKKKIWIKIKKILLIENKDELNSAIEKLKYIENDEENNNKIRCILLLYNILLMSKNKGVGNRYDFLRYNRWTIEHIHSQNEQLIEHKKEQIEKIQLRKSEIEKKAILDFEEKKRERYNQIDKIKNESIKEERIKVIEADLKQLQKRINEDKKDKIGKADEELKQYKSFEEIYFIRKEIIEELDAYYESIDSSDSNAKKVRRISFLFEQLDRIEIKGFDEYISKQNDLKEIIIPKNSEKHRKVLLDKLIQSTVHSNIEKLIEKSNNIEDIYLEINKILRFGIKLLKGDSEILNIYNEFKSYKNNYPDTQIEYKLSELVRRIEFQIIESFFKMLKENITNSYRNDIREVLLSIFQSEIDEYYVEQHNKVMNDDSIKNLTLLRSKENRAIANEYIKKKQKIHKFLKEGTVIPYSTLLVFFDAYSNIDSIASGEKWQWLPKSRDKYFEDLVKEIDVFFNDEYYMKEI